MAYQKSNWSNNDTGILRKKKENNLEELLVFGYSCKLFKDDERALQIDQGKHLIPCMSDETLQIDRYDVRGALADLSIYEANSANSSDYWGSLTNEERHIEQLCDKERYRALTHNEDEEALYQEEELKRLHQALGSDKTYGQVSYSYDNENGNSIDKPVEESNQNEDPDETFVPPNELDIPPGMVIPETVKLNAIIEKTAMFINQQGMQMEIILKMKQSGNPQFEFLSYKSSLHNYYRHLLMAIKTGRYKPKPQINTTEKSQPQNEESISEQSSYLHHSLSQAPSFNLTPLIPNINYKPSSDCAYSMLVNKIKGNQNKFNDSTKINSVILSETVVNENKLSETLSSSPKSYSQSLVTYDKNDEANDPFKPSSPSSVGQRPSRRRRHKRQQGAFAYNYTYDEETVDVPMLVDDSYIQQNDEKVQIVIIEPPYDVQLIIDKMASYVAKNGRNFEEIVKCKNDPRFNFLEATNEFYAYYNKKVEECEKNYKNDSCEDSNTGENAENSNRSLQGTLKPNPVCFSIKKPKETECLEIKSALPLEESTDEENPENESNNRENNENVSQNISKGSELYDPLDIMEEVDESMKEDRKSANSSMISSEKKNEEKIKDKLTAAAKESLAVKDRDKQLQLERKRRAEAFLNLIQKNKKSTSAEINETILIGPQLPDHLNTEESIGFDNNAEDKQETNDENSNAVSSPPSSVTSPEASVIDEPKLTDKKIDVSDISLLNKAIEVIDPSSLSASILLTKIKSSKRPKKEKYEHKSRYSTEYRHKHKKRKRSSSPSRYRRSKTSKPSAYASSNIIVSSRESKRHKHRKHRDSDKYYSEKSRDYVSSSRRKHKHYKSKKHKKKEKKHSSGESSGSGDSSETE